MSSQLLISVSFDPAKGYTAAHPGLAGSSLSALSLGGLRKQVAGLMLPAKVEVVLSLDKLAKRERDSRRQGTSRASDYVRAR